MQEEGEGLGLRLGLWLIWVGIRVSDKACGSVLFGWDQDIKFGRVRVWGNQNRKYNAPSIPLPFHSYLVKELIIQKVSSTVVTVDFEQPWLVEVIETDLVHVLIARSYRH